MNVRRRHIRELANQMLAKLGIASPPVDPSRLAESLGIRVVHQDHPDSDLSGFLFRSGSPDSTVIGVNGSHPSTRQRFTVAHECGHFLLHAQDRAVHVDRSFIYKRNPVSSTGEDLQEREANLFAAELLMPAHFLKKDIASRTLALAHSDLVVQTLAEKYAVSEQAMAIRLSSLGLLSL